MTSIPNIERPFDILVYGATGFTGKKVAKYLVESHPEIKLAIAGRNLDKLQQCASDIGLQQSSFENIFVAPTTDSDLLVKAISQAKIVLACAGPYRADGIGKQVVDAAIKSNTDYLDLCGEPQFFEDMFVDYDAAAQSADTLVISACAFDCVPAELSAKLVSKELKKRQEMRGEETTVSGIEIVHTFQNVSCANPTTFHAAVDGFHAASTGELKKSRARVKEMMKNAGVSTSSPARPEAWPKLPVAPGMTPVYHERSNQYILKFIGADAACVLSSDRYLRYRSAQKKDGTNEVLLNTPGPRLSVCFGIDTKYNAGKFLAYGATFSTLAKFEWGCKLLHNNPELFSGGVFREGGPTDEELKDATFTTLTVAYGKVEKDCVYGRCHGEEPGYVATPKILVALALTVLNHREKLPFSGGVALPGAVFGECEEVFKTLKREGVTFEIVDDPSGEASSNTAENLTVPPGV